MARSRGFDDEPDDRKSRRRSDDDDDDRPSRRRRNEDEEYEDSQRRRRGRGRKEDKPFPLVLVLILIFAPIVLIGGYFGIKAMRSGESSSTQPSTDDLKTVRAKVAGHWVYDHGGGERLELTFLDDDRVTWNVSMRNAGRSITTNYELIDWSKDRIAIRIHFDVHAGTVYDLRIEVVSEQQLRVTINSNSSPKIFTKQAPKVK